MVLHVLWATYWSCSQAHPAKAHGNVGTDELSEPWPLLDTLEHPDSQKKMSSKINIAGSKPITGIIHNTPVRRPNSSEECGEYVLKFHTDYVSRL